MSLVEQQQLVDFDAEYPLGIADVTVPAVEAEVEAELQRLVPEAFAVRCADTASWLVRRVLSARAYLERVKMWSEAEQRRARREEERLLLLFGDQLRRWALDEVTKFKGRRRSLSLPGGVVGFRATPARIVIRDEAVVMAWARRACPSAIVVSERLVKTPISEHVQQTGEVPDGVEVTDPRDEFFIR